MSATRPRGPAGLDEVLEGADALALDEIDDGLDHRGDHQQVLGDERKAQSLSTDCPAAC